MANETLVNKFVSVTGSDRLTASLMLEACANNLDSAVATYLDGGYLTDGLDKPSGPNDDNVRAPIPQTQGVLVDDRASSYQWMPTGRRSVFDGLNGFTNLEGSDERSRGGSKKLKKLEELFSPPRELMYIGTFQSACQKGSEEGKWLMVNLQNVQEFVCQAINRDVWSNKNVKALIKKHFIFWQERCDSAEGERYMNFYPVNKWPHVAVIDPRTGGRLATWEDVTSISIVESINVFLANHGSVDNENSSKSSKDDILTMDERDQLEAAITASLKDAHANHDMTGDESENDSLCSSTEEFVDPENEECFYDVKQSFSAIENGHVTPADLIEESKPPKKTFQKIFPKKRKLDDNDNPFLNKLPSKCARDSFYDAHPPFDVLQNTQETSNIRRNGVSLSTSNTSPANKCKLQLKYPDGTKEMVELSANSTLKELHDLLLGKRYDSQTYELLTNFPRKNISLLSHDTTLQSAGLFPQETIFIQEKL